MTVERYEKVLLWLTLAGFPLIISYAVILISAAKRSALNSIASTSLFCVIINIYIHVPKYKMTVKLCYGCGDGVDLERFWFSRWFWEFCFWYDAKLMQYLFFYLFKLSFFVIFGTLWEFSRLERERESHFFTGLMAAFGRMLIQLQTFLKEKITSRFLSVHSLKPLKVSARVYQALSKLQSQMYSQHLELHSKNIQRMVTQNSERQQKEIWIDSYLIQSDWEFWLKVDGLQSWSFFQRSSSSCNLI